MDAEGGGGEIGHQGTCAVSFVQTQKRWNVLSDEQKLTGLF